MTKPGLSLADLKQYSAEFVQAFSRLPVEELYGVDNGKTIGTFIEAAFNKHLEKRFAFVAGNAASGIDFPILNVDLKVTSKQQPQSSCPFRDATQKVYGLGYHLLVFVYAKRDDPIERVCHLIFEHAIFVEQKRTADFQTTKGILDRLRSGANEDDIDGFLEDRNLPVDEVGRRHLARRIMQAPPEQGMLTISNALQWRLQYQRVITEAGREEGVENLLR